MNRRRALMSVASSGPPTVHGTWEDLFARIADGTYSTAYSVGEILPLDLGTEGVVNAQIVAFNSDDKADGNGKAKVSFVSQYLLNTSKRWNPARSPSSSPYTEGTGGIGGWPKSELRSYLINTITPKIPTAVANRIVPVTKTCVSCNTGATISRNTTSTETVWLPSHREVFGSSSNNETSGVVYTAVFSDSASRIKKKAGATSATGWWHRSVQSSTNVRRTSGTGTYDNGVSTGSYGVALGFCID